jgi:D-alanyl-D-alanine carboxypeptidase (penicillin-binding protein 5/6)
MLRTRVIGSAAVMITVAAVAAVAVIRFVHDDSRRHYLDTAGWPAHGEGAYEINGAPIRHSPDQAPVPIASVAKVMTALVVLHAAPLQPGRPGFHLTVSSADVEDATARDADGESTVAVAAGEVLTERQALAALLLPSANNVAIMLARRVAGTVVAFVARMNAEARRLGMRDTHYTDPSGFAASTTSTAVDQTKLADVAMRIAVLRTLVGTSDYPVPVAGTVSNTDTLLGTHGVVGIKTGSDDAAQGCFMFRVRRLVGMRPVVITGVVLGQHGHNPLTAGLYAGLQLADHAAQSVMMRQTP